MSRTLKNAQPLVPAIRRFTIDSVSKYANTSYKTLLELLSVFPGYGQGFKIFLKRRTQDHWIVDHVNFKNNRHGKVFGLFYPNGLMSTKKIIKINHSLKPGLFSFEPQEGKTHSDNGVEYDVRKIEMLIEEKKKLLAQRNNELGFVSEMIKKKIELKEKKKIAVAGKKK